MRETLLRRAFPNHSPSPLSPLVSENSTHPPWASQHPTSSIHKSSSTHEPHSNRPASNCLPSRPPDFSHSNSFSPAAYSSNNGTRESESSGLILPPDSSCRSGRRRWSKRTRPRDTASLRATRTLPSAAHGADGLGPAQQQLSHRGGCCQHPSRCWQRRPRQ